MNDPVRKFLLAAALMATATTVRADDCAGNVDATGNECNGSVTVSSANEADVRKQEATQAAIKLDALRATVKQREMKVVIARTTLIGAEGDLERAREALAAEEKGMTKTASFW
jgi:hypothetical protein